MVNYEYLVVHATVTNNTKWTMKLKNFVLSWGKFDDGSVPVDVPAGKSIKFTARGRDSSPSGTEGTVTWKLLDNEEVPVITIGFDNPAIGKCSSSISIDDPSIPVSASGKSANDYKVTYTIG